MKKIIRTSSSLLCVRPQLIDSLLDLVEFPLEVHVVDHGGRVGDVAEQLHQLVELATVAVDGVLHQVVARRAVHAAALTVILVLLALVAPLALNVVVALEQS